MEYDDNFSYGDDYSMTMVTLNTMITSLDTTSMIMKGIFHATSMHMRVISQDLHPGIMILMMNTIIVKL